jgi:cation transport ATPase
LTPEQAAIYNLIAIPIAAGVLYYLLDLLLRPEVGALAIAAISIMVTMNALLLKEMAKKLRK